MFRLLSKLLLASIVALGSLTVVSCAGHPSPSSGEASTPAAVTDITNAPGSVYQVTFKPSTVFVDEKTVADSLLAVSDDGSILVFDDSSPQIQALAPGKTVLFRKIGLRKVTAVERRNNVVFVTVGQAALTDAIQNGHIAWNIPVNFGTMGEETVAYDPVGEWLRSHGEPAMAQGEGECGGNGSNAVTPIISIGNWHICAVLAPSPNAMNMTLTLKRENIAGMDLEVRGTGNIANFSSLANMQFANGQVNDMEYSASGLNGHVDFEWTAQKFTPGLGTLDPAESGIKLGLPKAKFPFLIGEIPFALEFSTAAIIKPGFSGKGELAHGSFSINYTGDAGFSASGQSANGKEDVHGEASINPDTHANISIGSFGIVVAMAIPKIELKTNFEIEEEENGESASQKSEGESAIDGSGQQSKFSTFLGKAKTFVKSGVKKLLDNEAGVYVEFIVSTGLSKESNAEPLVVPCTITTLVFAYKYGAEAKMLGITFAEPNSGVKKLKIWHMIDPPVQRCKDIATAGDG